MRVSGVVAGLIASAVLVQFLAGAPAGAEGLLTLERKIPLDGVSGRIDHMAIDPAGKRLFIAELGNGTVDVVDIPGGRAVQRIEGLKEPQGVAYLAEQDLIVVASAGDGSVRFFGGRDLSPRGTLVLGKDADNVRIAPSGGHIVVGYGDGALAIIDPATRSRVQAVRLAAHPESFQIDPQGDRAYVNVPDAHQVAVADLKSGHAVAAWDTPGLRSNFPMALAGEQGPLAVVFREPATLALMDTATGAMRQKLDVCGDADDVFFDPRRDRIYVSCGEGMVAVMEHALGKPYRLAENVSTARGARTSLFAPQLDRLFVAARAGAAGTSAAILVFRPLPS